MNYRKIEKYTIISLVIMCISLMFFDKKYSLGLLLGGLASLLGLKIIEKLDSVEINDYKSLKSRLRKNHLIRYLVYALVMFFSFFRPKVFSYITCFVGLLLTKFWLIIIESRDLKEG